MQRLTALAIMILSSTYGQSQTRDTLIDVGGYQLHFNIIKGKGMPILFEAGGGDNGSVWNNILKPIADVIGTTLITYDRPGFGKSGLDTNRHGIVNGIIGLETGLKKLGYEGSVMLVAHSLGGFYATLYASRHPSAVKAMVFIDANLGCFYTNQYLASSGASDKEFMEKFKDTNRGVYYIFRDSRDNIELIKKTPLPSTIPVIDLYSEKTPFRDTTDAGR